MKDSSGTNEELLEENALLKQRIQELETSETARKQAERRQYLAIEILGILNDPTASADSIQLILAAIKRETGFDAVGIRLRSGDDFPYFVQNGFSHDFMLTENTLIVRDANGGPCRDNHRQHQPGMHMRTGNIRTDGPDKSPFYRSGKLLD